MKKLYFKIKLVNSVFNLIQARLLAALFEPSPTKYAIHVTPKTKL